VTGLLDVDAVPDLPDDPVGLLAAAEAMAPAARLASSRVLDAITRWRTLPEVFETPDSVTLVSAMHPVEAAADDFEDATVAACHALRSLAETLTDLAWTRERLLEDIAARRSSVLAYQMSEGVCTDDSDPLWSGGPYGSTPDDDLAARCDTLRGLLHAALEECERDLRRIGEPNAASPVMWTGVSPGGPALTWQQRSSRANSALSLAILDRLSRLDAAGIAQVLAAHPDWLAMVRDHPPTAVDVAAWWRTLDATHTAALIAGAPVMIGNLEGVAYGARDVANRAVLKERIAAARAALEAEEAAAERNWGEARGGGEWRGGRGAVLRDRLATLLNIESALTSAPRGAGRHLISLTGDEPPLAAVSIGDLDRASSVTYAVPGMGTTTRGMIAWSDAAQNLSDEQLWADPSRERAVVAWIGYLTPPIPLGQGGFDVLSSEYARSGGEKLSATLSGLAATRPNIQTLNVVGHSYGTTTAAEALTLSGTPRVDTFVTLGSAGLPSSVDSVDALGVSAVYAGQARNVIPLIEEAQGDQWAWMGRTSLDHPVDPTDQSFGAEAFGADGDNGMHPVTDHAALVEPGKGWGYFNLGTEALRNTALATTGQGGQASPAVSKGRTEVQQYWEDVIKTPAVGL